MVVAGEAVVVPLGDRVTLSAAVAVAVPQPDADMVPVCDLVSPTERLADGEPLSVALREGLDETLGDPLGTPTVALVVELAQCVVDADGVAVAAADALALALGVELRDARADVVATRLGVAVAVAACGENVALVDPLDVAVLEVVREVVAERDIDDVVLSLALGEEVDEALVPTLPVATPDAEFVVLADEEPDCVVSASEADGVSLADPVGLNVAADSVALDEREARALNVTRAAVALTVAVRAPDCDRFAVGVGDPDGSVDADVVSLGLADELGQLDSESVPLGDGDADAE